MNDSSIAALALEESLLRDWSTFQSRLETLPAPPGTRTEADRMLRYSGNPAFVDSVVDALGLYLAGQNAFDRKLLTFLDLVLIQRCQPDDLTLLLKLIEHHAARKDLIALLGIWHRLELYQDRPSLGGVARFCSEQLKRFDVATDNAAWAQVAGIQPRGDSWHVNIRLGTAAPDAWISRKSALKPQDVSLELLVTSPGQWRVQVARVDRQFSAQWRPAGITIDTDQPLLKAVNNWPTLGGQLLFPMFAGTLARHLKVQWQRTALVTLKDATLEPAQLLQWLHAIVDSVQS